MTSLHHGSCPLSTSHLWHIHLLARPIPFWTTIQQYMRLRAMNSIMHPSTRLLYTKSTPFCLRHQPPFRHFLHNLLRKHHVSILVDIVIVSLTAKYTSSVLVYSRSFHVYTSTIRRLGPLYMDPRPLTVEGAPPTWSSRTCTECRWQPCCTLSSITTSFSTDTRRYICIT